MRGGASKLCQEGIRRTERTNNQKLVEWMNEIISEKNLALGSAEQDTTGPDRKQPDIIIRKTSASQQLVCVIELKNPAFSDIFNEEELVEPARKKATRRRAPYFGTSNFRELVLFNTARVNQMEPLEKQIVQRYNLSTMTHPDEIEEPGIKSAIRHGLERLLIDLSEISSGRRVEPRHPIDEILVYRLHTTIRALAAYYKEIIEARARRDRAFLKSLRTWFLEQGWSFSRQREDYEKAARQTAYLLVNKILFYSAIQPIRRLDPLQVPRDLTTGAVLQKILEGFFGEVLKLDYETIYSTDFIDQIAFPDNPHVVEEVKGLINVLSRYDFSRIGYDILGRIFERLIPIDERHLLGQYFTSPDIVDLILRFCLHHETDKVLDPACGAGTFLVRSYQHKRMMNHRLTHEELLKDIWSIDISKFPALLTTINLAINDLRSDENYPRVIRKDFFDLRPETVQFPVPSHSRKVKIKGLSAIEKRVEHPLYFDVIVGNPPYTRHLEIEDIQDQVEDYKAQLRQKALMAPDAKKSTDISRRAGIYAYFFVHGTKFLQNGGRFGFIVSNSWLDADYGKGLQNHFLSHYAIIAIIESKVERWFSDADVNTCIVILEKADGEQLRARRDHNQVRFAYLKKPLRHFIPPAESMWEKEIGRRDAVDALIKTVLAHSTYYENEDLRIYPCPQKKLLEEGFDPNAGKYVGAKWGKYIRAPRVFFKVMRKIEKRLIPINRLANINEGKPTGAESFFFVEKDVAKKFNIESRFLHPAIRKPRNKNLFELGARSIDHFFFAVAETPEKLKGTGALEYMRYGEKLGLHTRNTYAKKAHWYQFSVRRPAELIMSCGIGSRHYCTLNTAGAIASGKFTEIRLHDAQDAEGIWLFLNSSLGWLLTELSGRSGMGGGMLKVDPTDIRKLQVLDPKYMKRSILPQLKSLLQRPVGTVEEEASAEDRSLIDKYVLGQILGITKAEQQEIREAVIELVKTRQTTATRVRKSRKGRSGIDLQQLTEDVLQHLPTHNLATFFKQHIKNVAFSLQLLPPRKDSVTVENTLLGWQVRSGRRALGCRSEAEARYLRVFLEMGWREAPVPERQQHIRSIISKWENLFQEAQTLLEEQSSSILQRSVRERFARIFWQRLRAQMASSV